MDTRTCKSVDTFEGALLTRGVRPDIKDDFRLESSQTAHCMQQVTDLSEFCVAMANTARREARGFQHFMSWLGHRELIGLVLDIDV
jgi:hypothetical protein